MQGRSMKEHIINAFRRDFELSFAELFSEIHAENSTLLGSVTFGFRHKDLVYPYGDHNNQQLDFQLISRLNPYYTAKQEFDVDMAIIENFVGSLCHYSVPEDVFDHFLPRNFIASLKPFRAGVCRIYSESLSSAKFSIEYFETKYADGIAKLNLYIAMQILRG